MNHPRCPDCGVTMEEANVQTTSGGRLRLELDEPREGLLGSLGVNETADIDVLLCPECGLVRLYADLD